MYRLKGTVPTTETNKFDYKKFDYKKNENFLVQLIFLIEESKTNKAVITRLGLKGKKH